MRISYLNWAPPVKFRGSRTIMKLLFNGGDYRADASDINVTPTGGGGGGGEGWRCPQTSIPSSAVSTSDSRQIVVNPSGCRTGWVAVRKFNKAIIILSVLVLVNYCNGLSAVPSDTATASAIIPGDAEQWDQTYYQGTVSNIVYLKGTG